MTDQEQIEREALRQSLARLAETVRRNGRGARRDAPARPLSWHERHEAEREAADERLRSLAEGER
ncbi:MAG: hypothetical protein NW223_23640 [Hyphomicrobiaceae bacterium]|nr:hypothetical protein [Hyphomicrobiaceae bacterium]